MDNIFSVQLCDIAFLTDCPLWDKENELDWKNQAPDI